MAKKYTNNTPAVPFGNTPATPHIQDLQEFFLDRQARNLAPKTLLWYSHALTHWITYATEQGITHTDRITPSSIRRFLVTLAEQGHNAGGVASNVVTLLHRPDHLVDKDGYEAGGRIMIGYRTEQRVVRGFHTLSLLLVLLVVLFPIYWMLLTGIRPKGELYLPDPTLWILHPTLDNARSLFARTPYLTQLKNSLIVSTVTTTITIIVGALAGYSISRLRYPGRDFFASAIFFIYLIPGMLTLIPLYVFLSRLGLLNTLYSLMLAYLAGTVPFAIWVLKGYFSTIPYEMEDAALVDGCTRLEALVRVILPLAAPGLVACGIFAFTLSWNEYLLAMLFNNTKDLWTLPVGLAGLVYGDVFLWGEIMIGAFLMSIPVLILYVVAQRFVVTGLTAGAVKG